SYCVGGETARDKIPRLGRAGIEGTIRSPNTSSSCCEVKGAVILAAVRCQSKAGNSTGRCVGRTAEGQHVGEVCRARTNERPLSERLRCYSQSPRSDLGACGMRVAR